MKEVPKDDETHSCRLLSVFTQHNPSNYTLTHFADHSETFSHDQINRYLANDHLKPRRIWEQVKSDVVQTSDGYIIFDDTTLEKKHAEKIALAKHQYSGNARKVVNGIGVVTCVYVNPTLDRSWLIDYRIYDKQGDGKTKLDHVEDMLGVLSRRSQCCFFDGVDGFLVCQ